MTWSTFWNAYFARFVLHDSILDPWSFWSEMSTSSTPSSPRSRTLRLSMNGLFSSRTTDTNTTTYGVKPLQQHPGKVTLLLNMPSIYNRSTLLNLSKRREKLRVVSRRLLSSSLSNATSTTTTSSSSSSSSNEEEDFRPSIEQLESKDQSIQTLDYSLCCEPSQSPTDSEWGYFVDASSSDFYD